MAQAIEQNELKISRRDLINACCRAIYLWEFGDDKIESAYRISDEKLLTDYGLAWKKFKKNSRPIAYTDTQVKNLIRNCQVRKSQLTNPKNALIGAYLMQPTVISKSNTQNTYYSVLDRTNKAYSTPTLLRTRWQYGREFTKELANKLNARSVGLKGGVQKAFASRILFFSLPEVHLYNYSEPLVEKLKDKFNLTGETVDEVFEKMNELFELHEDELKKLPRPNFANTLKNEIKKGDWWERRVLDLAILQNWK